MGFPMDSMDEDGARRSTTVSDVLAGAGLGLMLGTLMGLSQSEVVGTVIAALAAVLAVFLGLDITTGSLLGALRINGARIGSLGLATVIGVGLGLYVRVNDPFLPTPTVQLDRWRAALPDDPTLAKQMMMWERMGDRPATFQFGTAPPVAEVVFEAGANPQTRRGVLFSTFGDYDVCVGLDPDQVGDTEAQLAAYRLMGVPPVLPKIAAKIAALPAGEQAAALRVSYEVLCAIRTEEEIAR
jgi:hypothetical protein